MGKGFIHIFFIGVFMTCLLQPSKVLAQDPQFGHYYNNALLYNPAFTGNVDLGRFSLSIKNAINGQQSPVVLFHLPAL